MGVFLAIKDAVGREFDEIGHHLLEREKSIALSHSAEVLTVLIGVRVEDKSGELVHALRVRYLRVLLEISVNNAGEAVVIVSLILVL